MAPAAGGAPALEPGAGPATRRVSRADGRLLALAVAIGVLVRLVLLPTQGLRDDTDQFAAWVHDIAVNGLGSLYGPHEAGPVTFGPVMGWIWGLLAAIAPGFETATDAADTGLRILLKTPATIADLGLALVAFWALRDRPRWAVVAAAAILLHPMVIDVSAWWGQYESIYVVTALAAAVAATRGRNGLAAALIAVSLMTKPQAIPFLVPFAAWFWATGYRRDGVRGGVLELVRTGAIGLAVIVVTWLPFLAQGGPANYLANVRFYQDEVFNVLSLRAWNPWWIVQVVAANGEFIVDGVPIIGPISFRTVGLLVTGLIEVLLFIAVVRDPRPRTLFLALAASTLVFFSFMTQMHERYAYAAAVFLVLLVAEPRTRWLAVAAGVLVTLNLWWAIPPAPIFATLLPIDGTAGAIIGITGSILMLALTVVTIRLTIEGPPPDATPEDGGATAAEVPLTAHPGR